MKPKALLFAFAFLYSLFFSFRSYSQAFGTISSAAWLTDCNQSNYFNTSGNPADLPGPAGNVFTNANLGAHTRNSGTLILRGAEVRTFKNIVANVCSVKMYYRIYLQSAVPGAFNSIDLPLLNDCDIPSSQFPSGGFCQAGDQKWNRVIPDGATSPYSPVNLTSFAPGNYVLEIYYDVAGSSVTTTLCDETIVLNNGGANYKAFFSIQAPVLASNNPTTCNGTEGYITISGLVANATYAFSYTDGGVPVGPVNLVANGAGQVILSGLNAGVYSDLELVINGCITDLFTGIILSNPVFTPTFPSIAPFCAGTTPPLLPSTSSNGIAGTWSPAVISNLSSGSYTFTPTAGQCGLAVTRNVTVLPRATPTFSFGTSLAICKGASVPALSVTSVNGFTGTWSSSSIDNQNSATYTFTPTATQCAAPASLTVTVNPILTTTFSFGTALTICAGQSVPPLPPASSNGITGTWSPASVDNQNSGTYNFTPNVGQCGTPATFDVTVNPNITPTFSFGTSLNICAAGTVPALPTTSDNAITGTWNPATVDNQNSATYTFTPTTGLCATTATFSVIVNPNVTPTFSFGTSLTICADGAVPALAITSANGITGTWNPAVVSDQASGTYTFTPTAGLCATTATFTVTVNPNITPIFSFGTSQTYCAGATVPTLPATSDNAITGTWNPSSVNNQNSATYTFTPTTGLCATNATFTVTVTPNETPIFSFGTSLTICAGGTVPALPTTSDNAITGTWNPASVSDQNSATYTFTPTAGLCATTLTFAVSVNPNITPTFSFGTSLTICADGAVPALITTSANGITGTWNPAVVSDQASGTYTFTPTAGLCATSATFIVTVNPNITPTFSFGTLLTICEGGAVPALPATSTNSITGTWNPSSVNNQNSATYTFTPTSGLCATNATFTVTVTPNETPTFSFGILLTICAGGTVPALPTTSDNAITGTWNPASVSDQNSATYTFTPTTGLCATTATFTVTVNPNITPTFSFGTSLTICADGAVPALITTSANGITGTWNPAVVSDQASGTYTFTPTAGLCATPATFTVTVNPTITPTFSFGTSQTYCAGATVPALPTTSDNAITGTWNPSSVNNQNSATYTFNPTTGLCATNATFTVTVAPNETPTFSFGTSLTVCAGGTVPALPTTSDNAITGTWNPATVSDQNSATYTFTPTAGLCATTATFTVTVNPNIIPTFSFGTSLTICTGGTVPTLPGASINGITGTWSVATVDDQNSATYTFTPTPGLCATTASFTVTVNPILTSTFSIGTDLTICSGNTVPALAPVSDNGISGTWSPATIDNQASGVYTFTPAAGQCGSTAVFTVTVTPSITPIFSFGTSLTICKGGIAPVLPTTSLNGYDGVWNPSVVNNQDTGVYTFTPVAPPGQCIKTITFKVNVNPILTPAFSFSTTLTICSGAAVPTLSATSANNISGTWNPAVVSNQASAVYTFTSTAGQCATATATFTVTVTPTPTVAARSDTTVNDGDIIPSTILSGTPAAVTYSWTNSNPAIGLPSSGTGNIPTFTATNRGNDPVSATITVTPAFNGCAGTAKTYIITVKSLNKDVFVPNVFSPNGDGKNDILFVYGNYIQKLEMRIFNQWGEQVELINVKTKGWNGTHRGKQQPVGVYVYVLQAELLDGRRVNLKGSVTLVR